MSGSKKSQRKFENILKMKRTYQKLWNTVRATFRGFFFNLSADIRKEQMSNTNIRQSS